METDLTAIADSEKPGFSVIWVYDSWRLAVNNDSPASHRENIKTIAKHLETDETFTLLSGSACIHCGDGGDTPGVIRRYELEPGRTFVVRRGTWHAVETFEGAKLLIAENADTGALNSVSFPINGAELPL